MNNNNLMATTFQNTNTTDKTNFLFLTLLKEEWFSIVEVWLRTHVSDHSAAHFGGTVLRLILQTMLKTTTRQDILVGTSSASAATTDDDGILFAQNAISSARRIVEDYPTHEVLWIFRRICSHAFLVHVMPTLLLSTANDDNHQQDATKRVMREFWSQEITALINRHGDDEKNAMHHKNILNDEVRLEATRADIFRLSYVVWVLECVIHMGRQNNCMESFLSEAYLVRSKVVNSLREIEYITHNVYRKVK